MLSWITDHSLILLLTAAWIFTFLWLWRMRTRLQLRLSWTVLISLLHVLYGVLCVKAFAILENGLRSGDFSAKGAMSLFGAVFFLPAAYFLGARLFQRDAETVFDVFVIPTIFTLFCARINCLISGCCLGLPIHGMDLRWPTREIELVFYLVLLALMIPRMLREDQKGRLYPLYMVCYGALRFVVEFFRVSEDHMVFHLSHFWAVICFCAGLSILLQQQVRQKKTGKRKKA